MNNDDRRGSWLFAMMFVIVAFTFTTGTFIAPVLGWHNRNRVVQASIAGEGRVIDAPEIPSYGEWRQFLRREKVSYVVEWVPWLGDTSDRMTEAWIAENPEDFSLVDDFGGRVRIFRPVWDAPPALVAGEPVELPHLETVEEWRLEYTSGVETSISATLSKGVRFSYAFTSPGSDYCDWRAKARRADWTGFSALSFALTTQPTESHLVVYVKDPGGHGSMKYRIDLSKASSERLRVELPLRRPDSQAPEFSLSRVGEIHLIFDDAISEQNIRGELTVSAFRLEPRRPLSTSTEIIAALEGARRSQS